MATFKICVFEHQKRQDGKFPVSIRVSWKRSSSYIHTEFYVSARQITKRGFVLKDVYIINELNRRIELYEDIKVRKLGMRIELYSARELAEFFQAETRTGTDPAINFVEFSMLHIGNLRSQGRLSTAATLNRTLNALIDFCGGRERVAITEITAKFLRQFESYLRSERVIRRKNQIGKVVVVRKPPVSDVTLYDYMTDIRVLFNAAIGEYNDEDRGNVRIAHYPFRKYKLVRRPENVKRNLSPDEICAIQALSENEIGTGLALFARDVFLLSFYLVGMNLADLYEASIYRAGRLEYERKKTRDRRGDRSFISIFVESEVQPLLKKYADTSGNRVFNFYNRYSDSHTFSSNVNKGLKVVAKAAGIQVPLSTYYARHSWATIARNKCGVSKDDIDLALNHVDRSLKMADTYIEKDWSIIDRSNRSVLDLCGFKNC